MSASDPRPDTTSAGARELDLPCELFDQRRLIDALLGLEEPFRSALFRYHVRGEALERISTSDGVPVATVRARLARGAELLRQRMEHELRGDRGAWIVWLDPLLKRLDELRAATRRSWTSIGGLAPWVVVVMLAAVASYVVFGERRSERESAAMERGATVSTVNSPTPGANSSNDASNGAGAEPRSSRAPASANLALPATRAVVRLRAVDGRGRAVTSATLRCDGVMGGEAPALPEPASAGPDGAIEVVLERAAAAPGRALAATIEFWAHLSAPDHAERITFVTANWGRALDLGDVVIERAGSIRGRVVDGANAPLANVDVVLTQPELDFEEQAAWPELRLGKRRALESARTGADGRYTMPQVRTGAFRVCAVGTGWAAQVSDTVTVDEGAATEVPDLVFAARVGVHRGVVVDERGAPLPSIRVDRRINEAWIPGVTTDERGRFTLDLMGATAAELHVFDPEGHRGALRVRDAGANAEATTYVLPAARRARFRVRDGAGAPVTRFEATTTYGGPFSIASRVVEDPSGAFELALPAAPVELVVEADGFERAVREHVDSTPAGTEVVIELAAAPIARGRLLDPSGAPLADVELEIVPLADPPRVSSFSRFTERLDFGAGAVSARTDAAGEFAATCRCRGKWVIAATVPGHANAEFGPFERADAIEPLVLRLPAAGAIAGRLLAPRGVPTAGLWVGASNGGARVLQMRVERDGGFALPGIAPGTWFFRRLLTNELGLPTRAPSGSTPTRVEVRAGATARVELDLRLEWEGAVHGALRWLGVDLDGWTAVLTKPEADAWTLPKAATLDSGGEFVFQDVPKGAGVLCVRDAARGRIRREVRRAVDLDFGDRRLDVTIAGASVRLSGWDGAVGLAFVTQCSNAVVVTTVVRPGPAQTDLELAVPAGQTELFELGAPGPPQGAALWTGAIAPGARVDVAR
ncbi:MAG: carboxypeptidase regulatory-like domain-containing protein [Planctomycetes bacterium]|nr:carboxypeptidase regulatory-like domain-containing protein [Planctomycetota bacterium]